MYREIFFLMIFCWGISTYSQYSLSEIEEYVLHPLFDMNINNKILQIVEEDEDSNTSRKWVFDKKGRLKKEFDFTEKSLTSSIQGETFSQIVINHKEYNYSYNSKNKLIEVNEIEVDKGDTLRVKHFFDYSKTNQVKESYRIKKGNILDMEIIKTTSSSRGLIDSINYTSIMYAGKMNSKSFSKTIYGYDKNDKLKEKTSYFYMNPNLFQENKEPKVYNIGVVQKFEYDSKERLSEILYYDYSEKDNPKLSQRTSFKYQGSNVKPIGVSIKLDKSYSSDLMELTILYDSKNNLSQIKSDYGNVFYRYEKR